MNNTINTITNFLAQEKMKTFFLYVTIFIFFLGVYILNILYPLTADDWGYSFMYAEHTGLSATRVSNVVDVLVSQYYHYFGWGGRSVVHSIAQFLLSIDIRIARLLNALAYIALFVMIYKIINKGKSPNAGLFILLNVLIWLIQPIFSIIILWMTASANYIWGALLIILFIYPYYLLFLNKTSKSSYLKCACFLLWGIISGWTNENASVAMIFLLVVFMLNFKYHKIKIPSWAIWGIVGACVGCTIMLLAPGNTVRSLEISSNFGLLEVSQFKLFKIRLYNLYNAGALRLSIFSIIYILFLFLYLKIGDLKNKKEVLFLSLAFLSSSFIAFVSLFPVPYFPRDVWTSIHIFYFIAVGFLYVNIPFTSYLMKISRLVVFAVLLFAFISHYVVLYGDVKALSVQSKERELFIEQEKKKGVKDVILTKKMHFREGTSFGDAMSEDKHFWTNVLYANYYGIRSVRLKHIDE